MSRMFIGTYGELTRSETWVECGHFLRGVRIMFDELSELDGDGNIAETGCGFVCDGDAVPAQNTTADYEFYRDHFSGKKSVAFLCGEQLWIFKLSYLGNRKHLDERISISPKHGYDSPRQAEQIKFFGWIPSFEVVTVKDFAFEKGKLKYKTLARTEFGRTHNISKNGSGGGLNKENTGAETSVAFVMDSSPGVAFVLDASSQVAFVLDGSSQR